MRDTPGAHNERPSLTDGVRGYAPVNGLEMYYEIHGNGSPLVLLHGGPTTIDTTFGPMLPTLARTHKIVAVEQQGHGHTADIDRPMSYEQMADDTAELLNYLEIDRAAFFGFSDGGIVGLGVAIRHPRLVRKLAVAGTNFNVDGLTTEALEFLKHASPDDFGGLRDAYERVAPRPAAWPALVAKVMKMATTFKGYSPDALQAVQAPVLIAVGDRDMVRLEHAVELFRLLPRAELAMLPSTDHVGLVTRPERLLSMVLTFLDAPVP
jgi:pimeloyl-ACP methyl ester carboxylesterase